MKLVTGHVSVTVCKISCVSQRGMAFLTPVLPAGVFKSLSQQYCCTPVKFWVSAIYVWFFQEGIAVFPVLKTVIFISEINQYVIRNIHVLNVIHCYKIFYFYLSYFTLFSTLLWQVQFVIMWLQRKDTTFNLKIFYVHKDIWDFRGHD